MNNEQTQTLSLKAAYSFGVSHGLEADVNEIRNMVIEWDSSYTSSLRRGYIVSLFENHGIFEDFKAAHWAFGNSPTGETRRRRYLRIKTQYEEFLAGRAPEPDEQGDAEASADSQEALEFALEAHLRDFLARNLDRLETGLRLYTSAGLTDSHSLLMAAASICSLLIVPKSSLLSNSSCHKGAIRRSASCSTTWVGLISILATGLAAGSLSLAKSQRSFPWRSPVSLVFS